VFQSAGKASTLPAQTELSTGLGQQPNSVPRLAATEARAAIWHCDRRREQIQGLAIGPATEYQALRTRGVAIDAHAAACSSGCWESAFPLAGRPNKRAPGRKCVQAVCRGVVECNRHHQARGRSGPGAAGGEEHEGLQGRAGDKLQAQRPPLIWEFLALIRAGEATDRRLQSAIWRQGGDRGG